MYNEFFAIPLNLFGTCYTSKKNGELILSKEHRIGGPDKKCVYPVGLDPSWVGTVNELTFTNSLKMKLSIIVGVLHMMLGIFLKGLNDNYFRNFYGIIFEFIPQFIFMTILFGYMVVMIFIKWSTYFADTSKAPSIITHLINLAIKGGSVGNMPLWGHQIEGTGRYQ